MSLVVKWDRAMKVAGPAWRRVVFPAVMVAKAVLCGFSGSRRKA